MFLACQASMRDFFKSSSGARSSALVLLDIGNGGPDNLSTIQLSFYILRNFFLMRIYFPVLVRIYVLLHHTPNFHVALTGKSLLTLSWLMFVASESLMGFFSWNYSIHSTAQCSLNCQLYLSAIAYVAVCY